MPVKTARPKFGTQHIKIEDSALVEKVFYCPDTKTLDAVFKAGTRYRYSKVPPVVFARFVLAKSMGKFFNTDIKGQYDCKKVRVATPKQSTGPADYSA